METFNSESILGIIIKTAVENEIIGEDDYINEDGLRVCGKCGEIKQTYIYPRTKEDGEVDRNYRLIVPCSCRCVRDAKEKEDQEQRRLDTIDRIKRLRSLSLMDKRFERATFDNFEIDKNNERILKSCKRYVRDFDENLKINKGLLFWGGVGTGKSFAAACIANELLSNGVSVVMTSFVNLIGKIQEGNETESDILNRINKAKLLILDDLGAERSTEYAIERVYNIIDSRYRAEMPMIVTTNLTLSEMTEDTDKRFSRIYDRLFEACVPVQFTGTSWRKRVASKRFKSVEANTEE